MKEYISVWHKSSVVKALFLLVGIIVIGLVSWMVVLFTWVWLLLVVIFGYWYWIWSKALLRIRYYFNQDSIRIVLPSRKEVVLNKAEIDSMSYVTTWLPVWRSVGVFIDGQKEYCITSPDNLLEIVTKDRIVVISPRRIDSDLIAHYTS
jgi:signal transduction histidine kinase